MITFLSSFSHHFLHLIYFSYPFSLCHKFQNLQDSLSTDSLVNVYNYSRGKQAFQFCIPHFYPSYFYKHQPLFQVHYKKTLDDTFKPINRLTKKKFNPWTAKKDSDTKFVMARVLNILLTPLKVKLVAVQNQDQRVNYHYIIKGV